MKLRFSLGLGAVLVVAVMAAPAAADPTYEPLCPSSTYLENPISGNYRNLAIRGNAWVASGSTLTVHGNLTLAPGACLDAFSLGTVKVAGNVLVKKGATLALGCTPGSLGPPFTQGPCFGETTDDVVGGNVVGDQPLTMYLDGDTVRANVISEGGGPGLSVTQPFLTFPVKDNTIGGNLILQDWHGGWTGAIRNTVGGNVIFSRNISVQDPDANEVVTNNIGGNLICFGNSPAVQVGDSMGSPNTVGGRKIGQCTAPGL